jgi:hypothetical protein
VPAKRPTAEEQQSQQRPIQTSVRPETPDKLPGPGSACEGGELRQDVRAALDLLDAKTQRYIRDSPYWKVPLEQMERVVDEAEHVWAIAPVAHNPSGIDLKSSRLAVVLSDELRLAHAAGGVSKLIAGVGGMGSNVICEPILLADIHGPVRLRDMRVLMSTEYVVWFDEVRGSVTQTHTLRGRTRNACQVLQRVLTERINHLNQRHEAHRRRVDPDPDTRGIPPASSADELLKLVQLRRDGALTDEEFAMLKSRLIGRGATPGDRASQTSFELGSPDEPALVDHAGPFPPDEAESPVADAETPRANAPSAAQQVESAARAFARQHPGSQVAPQSDGTWLITVPGSRRRGIQRWLVRLNEHGYPSREVLDS